MTKEVQKSYLYLRSCGCLISKKALNEFSKTKTEKKCPNCNVDFCDFDIVMLDPLNLKKNSDINEENILILRQKGLSHSKLPLKKPKKKKIHDEDDLLGRGNYLMRLPVLENESLQFPDGFSIYLFI